VLFIRTSKTSQLKEFQNIRIYFHRRASEWEGLVPKLAVFFGFALLLFSANPKYAQKFSELEQRRVRRFDFGGWTGKTHAVFASESAA
jgi:hypothetical protein